MNADKPKSALHYLGETTVLKNIITTTNNEETDYRPLEEFRDVMKLFARDYLRTFLTRDVSDEDLDQFEKKHYGQL